MYKCTAVSPALAAQKSAKMSNTHPFSYWLVCSSELLAEEKKDLNKKGYKDQMQRHHWATPRPDIGQTGRKKMAKGR